MKQDSQPYQYSDGPFSKYQQELSKVFLLRTSTNKSLLELVKYTAKIILVQSALVIWLWKMQDRWVWRSETSPLLECGLRTDTATRISTCFTPVRLLLLLCDSQDTWDIDLKVRHIFRRKFNTVGSRFLRVGIVEFVENVDVWICTLLYKLQTTAGRGVGFLGFS